MKKIFFSIALLTTSIFCFSQNDSGSANTRFTKKGRMYLSWGYNRATFGKSDIHFTGQGYDFTLKNLKAADRPDNFDPSVYFSISKLSIPQFNFRVGYFLKDNLSLSIGYDHMKYVVDDTQYAPIYGYIDSSASAEYAGIYKGEEELIHQDFVKFEHTDGLNYASVELEYHDNFWQTNNQKFSLDFMLGAGAGLLIPKTNAIFFNKQGTDSFHVAGAGISGNMGFRFYFFKHFYVQGTGKTGFLFMPDIVTDTEEGGKADQNIKFFEFYAQFGGMFSISKK